jgi:exodeoxyribonuclease V gamma subunit
LEAGLEDQLTLPVVRSAVLTALTDAGISQRFLAGMVNFGTLMPMRAIPFKVVCLLGMNDGEYPRSRPALDFDLMAGAGRYRPGDRSRREDDRYLFLEALLSAREKLYISYIGRSVRDNSPCVPSVLVGQLRDYLAAGWTVAGCEAPGQDNGDRLLAQLTCRHPLQPFSQTYFQPQKVPGLFTYAHEWRRIHDPRKERPAIWRLDPPRFETRLGLAQLIRFLKNPVQNFFNQRLNVFFDEVQVATEAQEPFALDRLAPFDLGTRLLEAGLAADPEDSAAAVERAVRCLRLTGDLPLHGFGEMAAAQLAKPVERMLAYHSALREQFPYKVNPVEIGLAVELDDDGCDAVEDWLDGLYRAAQPSESESYARWEFYPNTILDSWSRFFRLDRLISPWVNHLAGCAQGLGLTSYLVAPDGLVELSPLDRDSACKWLTEIVTHWWSGLQEPLPVTAKTALAYLRVLHSDPKHDGQKAVDAARQAYQGDGRNALGELGYSPYLKRIYADFDALWQVGDNRFTTLAEVLYEPLAKSYSLQDN